MNQFNEADLDRKVKFRGKYRIDSARLKNYDYSSDGAYFITICTKNREHYFGEIINGKLQETDQSNICLTCWLDLPNHYANCVLDAFVIMPNHVHGVVFIQNPDAVANGDDMFVHAVETGFKPVSTNTHANTDAETIVTTNTVKRHSISEIFRGFKTFTARKINDFQGTQGISFWQSRFYDRIIRSDDELARIRKYIQDNPANWGKDRNNMGKRYLIAV